MKEGAAPRYVALARTLVFDKSRFAHVSSSARRGKIDLEHGWQKTSLLKFDVV